MDQAKLNYFANTGGFRDVIDTSILFGDPALKLRMPATPPTAPAVAIAADGSAARAELAAQPGQRLVQGAARDRPPTSTRRARRPGGTVNAGSRRRGPTSRSPTRDAPRPPVTIIGDVTTNYFWVIRSRNGDGACPVRPTGWASSILPWSRGVGSGGAGMGEE